MSRTLSVLGMDPSLNNWGLAYGKFHVEENRLSVATLDVIQPDYSQGKQVRQNSKDLERAQALFTGAYAAAQHADAVFVEVPVGSQSARAMASYAICVGVLGALRASGIPFFEITPAEVKQATIGSGTASKAQIIERAVNLYPDAGWPTQTQKGVTKVITGKAEHMADAIGAIEAGITLPLFRQYLNFTQARKAS